MGIEVLIFAGVAVFLLLRLKDILGKGAGRDKPDHPFQTLRDKKQRDAERDARDKKNEGSDTPDPRGDTRADPRAPDVRAGRSSGSADKSDPLHEDTLHEDPEIDAVLREIQNYDRSFHPSQFIEGAEYAYEMVLNGFARGDLNELRGLMSPDVFGDFKIEIDRRADAGETLEITLVGFDDVKITGASIEGKTAEIDVVYTTQQINVMRGPNGESLSEGEPVIETQVDEWTLVRKLTSRDPNWTLVSLTEGAPGD